MLESESPGDSQLAREILIRDGVIDPAFTAEDVLRRFTELCEAANRE